MTVSKIRLPDNTEHDIRAKYLIQSSSSDATSAEFSARTVTDDAIANIQKIYGNTYPWNQLYSTRTTQQTSNGVICTYSNNIITINGKATSTYFSFDTFGSSSANIVDHKYLFKLSVVKDTESKLEGLPFLLLNRTGNRSASVTNGIASFIYTNTSSDASKGRSMGFSATNLTTITFSDVQFRVMQIDLTSIYGSGNEPTVSEFESLFPSSYYPYDPGSHISNSATAILSREFNLWDEIKELGDYSTSGAKSSNNYKVRSANKIPVSPGSTVFYKSPIDCNWYLFGSDGSTIVGLWRGTGGSDFDIDHPVGTSIVWYRNTAKVIPSNCCYIAFSTFGSTYSSAALLTDFCINISDTSKNGTYEPYNGHQIDLGIPTLTGKLNGTGSSVVIFPNGVQSNGTTRDELTATSAIKRMADDNSVLSSPQEYILDNALQLQYPVVAGGTEMVLPTTGTAPMKMDVIYGNAADAAATMSQNFISVDSMKEFLAALGTQMGGTWSMGYQDGKHTFTFTSN